ncbi:U3 small nucleolar RNA-associated protein 14 homolog A [Callorhinchus milii]|uniref:U3 small nucleolar RNA-associated protein 14 homolog A n=1 Tax=Callorhinchus milii TaxID=7868 RepID=UPI00045727E8|nr:U3 small nucleolar RNA-associated protein 14 homolog A [Callorhinchus milii]|eukprot:gi/632935389/ref/XP_007889902.1/ PREDICTED: U3 small nucleolar RNA-associated protein 14 homolog A [Callorhinchus milii]
MAAATGRERRTLSARDLLGPKDEEEENLFQTKHVMSDSENEEGSDDESKHQKLLEAISSLDGKKRRKLTERTEASLQVSEFTISSGGAGEKIELSDLLQTIRPSATSLNTVKKQLTRFKKKNKTLDLPLSKQVTEKIQRSVADKKTSKEVAKWDHVVFQNRRAEQLVFPLNQESFTVKPMEEMIAGWKARTPLEQEIFNLLHKNNQPVNEPLLTAAERASLQAMSLDEAKARRAELQKARALQSYYEAKAKRSKKIKSKKFHRVLKKAKKKQFLKDFEELKKTNPEAALEEMKKLESIRIKERMSLRHQNSGKWAKSKVIMAKYDNEARNAIQEQLEKNKALTAKLLVPSESEDEVEEETGGEIIPDFVNDVQSGTPDNPWMLGKLSTVAQSSEPQETEEIQPVKVDENEASEDEEQLSEDETLLREFEERRRNRRQRKKKPVGSPGPLDETVNGGNLKKTKGRKNLKATEEDKEKTIPTDPDEKEDGFDEDVNEFNQLFQKLSEKKPKLAGIKAKKARSKKLQKKPAESKEEQIPEEREEPLLDQQLDRKRTMEELDALGQEGSCDIHEVSEADPAQSQPGASENSSNSANAKPEKKKSKKDKLIDIENVLMVPSKTISAPLVPTAIEEENEEVQEDQRMIIREAFASDNVIDDFMKEKQKQINANKPKHVDLTLPGWGEWGGVGLHTSKRKRRKFLIEAAPAPPRKDQKLPNVIISEKRDIAVAGFQVSELPFPFSHREHFEKSIRAPIGKTWNTEKATKRLTLPKIVTKMGAIIEPISEEDVTQDQRRHMNSNMEQNSDGGQKRQWKKPRKPAKRGGKAF